MKKMKQFLGLGLLTATLGLLSVKTSHAQCAADATNIDFSGLDIDQLTEWNTSGGTNSTDGLKIQVNRAGNFQITREGQKQIFESTTDQPSAFQNVVGTVHGILLSIGTTTYAFGSLGSVNPPDNSDYSIVGYTPVDLPNISTPAAYSGTFTCNVAGSTSTQVMQHTITHGGKDYILKVTYVYTVPNVSMDATYEVTLPAGAEPVKLAHGWDTYLGGNDQGPGKWEPQFNRVSVKRACNYQAIEYVSGLAWSGYYSGVYSAMADNLDNDMAFNNTINTATNTDNGIGMSIDFGTTQGVQSTTNRIYFGPCPAGCNPPSVTAAYAFTCSERTKNLNTLATDSTNLRWYTDSTLTTQVTNLIISASDTGTYYAVKYDSVGTCFSPYSPVSVTDGCACLAGTVAPNIADASNTCPATTVDLTSLTNSGTQPAGTSLVFSTNSNLTSVTSSSDTLATAAAQAAAAGTYYAYYYDNTQNCLSPGDPIVVTINQCANPGAGTLDCNKTVVVTRPVAGTAGQKTLQLELDVTTAGRFEVSIAGSGFTLVNGATTFILDLAVGNDQKVYVPVLYDGSALATTTVTVVPEGSTTSITGSPCALDLTDTTGNKGAVIEVWTKDCVPTCGPALN